MSIYIKGMKIPKVGVYTCELDVLDENTAVLTIYTPIDELQRSYKLIPIPEGHGDLIDRDSMVEEWVDEKIGNPHADYEADDVIYDLKKRTVIVPKDKAHEP